MRGGETRLLAIVSVFFALACIINPFMPDYMASHWNMFGEVDGYIPRVWGVFLLPFMALAVALLFAFFGKADPYKHNIKKFADDYDNLVNFILLFLFYVYLLTLSWNFGYRFNMTLMLVPAFSALLFFVGYVTARTKRNFTVGFRTPWTLSNDKVWNQTHKVGGMLFKLLALVNLVGLVFVNSAFWILLISVLAVSVFLVFYSYSVYARIKSPAKKQGKKEARAAANPAQAVKRKNKK
jgi:uncharacterized membrane protein